MLLKKMTKFTVLIAAVFLLSQKSVAQDLNDTLESELDALSTTSPSASAPVTPTPGKNDSGKSQVSKPMKPAAKAGAELSDDLSDSFADEAPLKDPFEDDAKQQSQAPLKTEKSEMQPLETSSEPPLKVVKPESAPRPVNAAKAAKKPIRSEPQVAAPTYAGSLAPGSDEPNSNFESRLSSIYAEHSDPVSDEKWTGLLGARAAESYSVQAGDTLWDLSQTLFADGFYWSKLWAENPEIQNPHQISKGQAIRFIGGTEASPPEVRVVKDEPDQLTIQTQAAFEKEDVVPAMQEPKTDEIGVVEIKTNTKFAGQAPNRSLNQAPYYQEDIEGKITQADLEAGVVVEQSEIVPRPILPPPSEERRKVLLDIPRSFKETRIQRMSKTVSIQRRSKLAEKVPGAVVPPFMAFEKIPEPMGEVTEVDQSEVASLGQNVFIKGNEALTIGAKYYTISPRFSVRSPISGYIGEAAEVGGVLRIDELVSEDDRIYRARIVFGVNPVRKGSLVLAGEPPRIPVTTVGRRLSTELTISGGSDAKNRYFFGDGSTVFLDVQGSGVRIGDVLSVQARLGERKKSVAPNHLTPIGLLKVFAVSGQVASAIVVLATDDIRVGDRTGGAYPSRLPDLVNEAPRITRASAE